MDETAVVRHVSGSRGPVIKATSKTQVAIDRVSDRRSCISLASITMPASKELGNHHTLNIADALLGEDWQRELVATKISLEHPLHHAQMAGAVRKLWGQWSNQICDRHSRRAPSHNIHPFFCKARRCGVRLVYLPATFLPSSSMLRKVG